ncbi:SGNH/GDSL hydrolase family protein [Kitasatospora sp. NPDC056327]|uniref:SGNH/GDSL hydrolase family protein n=1 Tax=Kitasatospora sp. NPDC056327 TaxID=3345785 RepID=UPI0035D673DD
MARLRTQLALVGSAAALTAGAAVPVQPARSAEAAERRWVAMGDSYAAGVIPAAGSVFEVPRDGCERTDQSYPQVVARHVGGLVRLTDVSCGAATIANVTDEAQAPIGHQLPPYSEDPGYPFPPVPPQSAAAGPGTDVITVGVGGNTLGLAGIITRCAALGHTSGGEGTPCEDALSDGVAARLEKVRREYGRMLAVLHERSPRAAILAVGSPTIIPGDTAKCRYGDLTQFGAIAPGDLDWLRRDVLEPLNEVIEASAGAQEAARFVNLYDSSKDHSVCDTVKWVEGFVSEPGRLAFVHPNARGHRAAAALVEAAMLNALG